MRPVAEFPPEIPFTCHQTFWLEVLVTVALKVCRSPMASVALAGVSSTPTDPMMVMDALAETLGSALLRARTMTEPPAGMDCGEA
jgi:hypothetical protein